MYVIRYNQYYCYLLISPVLGIEAGQFPTDRTKQHITMSLNPSIDKYFHICYILFSFCTWEKAVQRGWFVHIMQWVCCRGNLQILSLDHFSYYKHTIFFHFQLLSPHKYKNPTLQHKVILYRLAFLFSIYSRSWSVGIK